MSALNVAVIIDFDPVGYALQPEGFDHVVQHFALAGGFREAAVERLDRVALRLFDQTGAVAALGDFDAHLAADSFGQGLGDQIALGGRAVGQHQLGRRHFFVKLRHEAGQHFIFSDFGSVDREEAAMPPILATTNEEGLDAHRSAFRCQRENVGVAQPFGVDGLAALNEGQRL